MKDKQVLSESFFIKDKVSKSLKLDLFYLKNNVIKNYSYGEFQNKNIDSPLKYYLNLSEDINVKWLYEYFDDFYNLYHKKRIEPFKASGIFLLPNESVDFHNHIDYLSIDNSPDVSGLFVVEGEANIQFEYNQIVRQNQRFTVPLKQREYILFSSDLKHSILPNKSSQPLIIISFKFVFPR